LRVSFALFSEHATGVELCLFDAPDAAFLAADLRDRGRRAPIDPGREFKMMARELFAVDKPSAFSDVIHQDLAPHGRPGC
jgi:pullulanase/glycogen debranching enzyme